MIEIEQLIRRANQQSLFERNFACSIIDYERSVFKIRGEQSTISDFALIKEAIDKDIELLEKSDLPDISRIYREIDDILNAVAVSTFMVIKRKPQKTLEISRIRRPVSKAQY